MAEERDKSPPYNGPERRQAPRDVDVPRDWESVALSRVAGRVKELDESAFGWEKDVLKRLRRHLDDPGKT